MLIKLLFVRIIINNNFDIIDILNLKIRQKCLYFKNLNISNQYQIIKAIVKKI